MLQLLVLYAHLIATCTAIGAILATDLRLLGKLADYRVRIAPPNVFVTRLVGVSLVVLCASGAALLWFGLDEPSGAPVSPKLQAKLVLVALLALNAAVLHGYTFPRLARGRRFKAWNVGDAAGVAVPIALSNCLWLYCAFLGIARPWNHTMSFDDVLRIAAVLFVLAFLAVMLLLAIAARERPLGRKPDAIDRLKQRLGRFGASLAAGDGRRAPLSPPPARARRREPAPPHLVPKMRSPASPRPGTM